MPRKPPRYDVAVVDVAQKFANVGVSVAVSVEPEVQAESIPAVPPDTDPPAIPRDDVDVSV
jgi:hypothetical protein